MLLMTYVEMHKGRRNDIWFLDSGCSNHMCGDRSLFCELDEEFKQMVKLGDNTRISVVGKGTVKLFLNGVCYIIAEVFHVPELKNNLLSIGQLQERGLAILIKSNKCNIYHPTKGLIIQTDITTNRMFIILSKSPATNLQMQQTEGGVCMQATSQNLAQLWHQRYDHISHKGIRILQQKEIVKGLPNFPKSIDVCTDCLKGKQHRDPIPKKKSTWRAS